jgi:F-type H+-transporting ATPase subunit gamma
MTRLSEIQSHIVSMSELLDVVGAMRSLAGMRVQEAQRTLPGVRRYAAAMADAISAAMLLIPEPTPMPPAHGRRALLLFTAEHGFVGGFNQFVVDSAEAAPAPQDVLFVLGSRGAALALEQGRATAWTRPMATRATSAPGTVRLMTAELYSRIASGEVSRVEVVFARSHQASRLTIERRLLLPLDLASLAEKRSGQAPFHNLEPRALVEKLMAEYVFALLTEAAIESIASENVARFAAMDSAHENVTKKLAQLHQSARQARQTEVTTELLDLVTGAEALAPPTQIVRA